MRKRSNLPLPRPATAALLGALCLSLAVTADVRLPALFSDHMVLQQQTRVPVWGWADPGETVTVSFLDQSATTVARDGRWQIELSPLSAGGPHTLTVTGKNQILLTNVLVGEVWIASGQSNMEWSINRSADPAPTIAAAIHPNLRLFTVPKLRADAPVEDVQSAWVECHPGTVPNFSAVAYHFGRALEAARGVPVGLIHTSWGGSPAEVWMSQAALEASPEYRSAILEPHRAAAARHQQALEKWESDKAQAARDGTPFTQNRPNPPWKPAELYNGMIAPLIPFAIRGAIWYQGESNAGRAWQYRRLFPDLILNWRRDWNRDAFPFLAVQLAPWDRNRNRSLETITATPTESDWAELREAQDLATRILPNVGLAVITDVGDKDDIHPARKAPVGERLALAARVIAHQEPIAGLSPTYHSVTFNRGRAIVRFNHLTGPLQTDGQPPTGFAIAGPDRQFIWANARLRGRTVEVSHPDVPNPVAVRFGWADHPVVNLFSPAGLPVSPFRTDDWPMVSGPKP